MPETNLQRLIAGMTPSLDPRRYVFTSVPDASSLGAQIDDLAPIMVFDEDEGRTLILEADAAAQAGLTATFVCRRITLNVFSALEAVGFLAAVCAELVKADISTNAVSAFHHDHLFIAEERADQALDILLRMAAEQST